MDQLFGQKITRVVLFWLLAFIVSIEGQRSCYGTLQGNITACQPDAGVSACCKYGDICFNNGLCVAGPGKEALDKPLNLSSYTVYYENGCTDASLTSPLCDQTYCRKFDGGRGNGVKICPNLGSNYFCCYGFSGCDCTLGNERVFTLGTGNITVLTTIAVPASLLGGTTSTTTSTSATTVTSITPVSSQMVTALATTTVPTPTAVSSATSQQSSSGNKLALGLGLGLGIPLILMIIIGFFVWRRYFGNKPTTQNGDNMQSVREIEHDILINNGRLQLDSKEIKMMPGKVQPAAYELPSQYTPHLGYHGEFTDRGMKTMRSELYGSSKTVSSGTTL